MKGWEYKNLGDLAEKITKGTTPTTMGFEFTNEGVNFIKAESISRNGEIDPSAFAKIDFKTHEALKRSQIRESDILITIAGIYLGKIGLVKKEYLPANTNQAVALIRLKRKELLPGFLKYLLLVPSTTFYLNSLCPQSAQPNLNLTQLGKLKLPLPPLPIQKKIAAILSAYDDLIENNKRRIALLEKMAEELYREWFVRLRFPGHEGVKITKGVPEGWEVRRIGEIYHTSSGGTPPRSINSYYNGKINWFKTGELTQIFVFSSEEKISEQGFSNSAAKLFSPGTVIIAMYCAMTNISILTEYSCTNQACCAFLPKNEHYSSAYTYYLIKSILPEMVLTAHGAAQQNLSQENIKDQKIFLPELTIIKSFTANVLPIHEEIKIFLLQNQKITETRDRLLSRLMSGKIDVENLDIRFPPSMQEEESAHA
jgi:type I restriction enzyme S subunit